MLERKKAATFAVSSITALVVVAAIAAAATFTRAPAARAEAASVTGSAQPASAALVAHYTVNQGSTAAATAAQLRATTSANTRDAMTRSRVNAQTLARDKAEAKQSAPRSDFTSSALVERSVTSFPGIQSSAAVCPPVGCNPPDGGLAASSRWVLDGANTSFAVFDTRGNLQAGWPKTFQAFFDIPDPGACAGHIPFTSDPREFFDLNSGRFVAAALELEGAFENTCALKSVYYIAVSQTGDPRGAWNVYVFDMTLGANNVADFTQIGFDGKNIYFSANMFAATQNIADATFSYAEAFGANKAAMDAGESVTSHGFFNFTVTGPAGSFLVDTVQPAETIAAGAGPSAELFVDTFNGFDPVTNHGCSSAADACRGLAVWAFSNRGEGAPSLSFAYVANTKAYTFAPAADQTTCKQCIDSGDLRISATPIYRDGALYAGWETGVNNGTQVVPGIVWSKVRTPIADGRVTSANQERGDYFNFGGDAGVVYPALMPDSRGNLFMVFDDMSSTVNPEVRLTALHNGGNFASPGLLIQAGQAPYRATRCGTTIPVCRWGDYSATSYDGFAHDDVFFLGEYANNSTVNNRNWGTVIGKVS
ncbi:MAG TPA: hypothetical protein VF120_10645 [Ktedonobacterales bacterium]